MSTIEGEVDNVAPKIVAMLGLNSSCDITGLRQELVSHCREYEDKILKKG